MVEEIWRDVCGYEGLYMVSSLGSVKSLNYNKTGEERILKPGKCYGGYLQVSLFKNSEKKWFRVHRLVAIAFIDNPDNKPHIDHINTIRTDNRADNLHWVTHKENMNNPISRKRHINKSPVTKLGKNNCNSKEVFQYSLDGKLIRNWYCTMDAERELGFDQGNISSCCIGKRKTAYGFVWRYAEELDK